MLLGEAGYSDEWLARERAARPLRAVPSEVAACVAFWPATRVATSSARFCRPNGGTVI